eukprot:TRINITY_DN2326_c0_g1_i2.p1 TRINITY_DN2326_c0_g1~~TRINITY_DN2326_c0_g1_i2.p1  ORF type:complete len:171 (-),score=77.07 TRINITY_DN2326_c0_g1_i2:105-617(-)
MSTTAEKKEIEIEFAEINERNIGLLRVLNKATFPVNYNDKFYSDLLIQQEYLAKLVYFNDVCIGAVCCRLECNAETKLVRLYIMTLGVLAPYRGFGVGNKMIKYVMDNIVPKHKELHSIYLHVHTINEVALSLYQKHGFTKSDVIHNYYKDINPPDCYIVEKVLVPSEGV